MSFTAVVPGELDTGPAAVFIPDKPITVTRVTTTLRTAAGADCREAKIQISDGTTGQDIRIPPESNSLDTGPIVLTYPAGANLEVEVTRAATGCAATPVPAQANVVVHYRMQSPGDTNACAPGHTSCFGICGDIDLDPDHCGGCGIACVGTEECCNNSCVDTFAQDPSNCGGCGIVCDSGEICTVEGFCAEPCNPLAQDCASSSDACYSLILTGEAICSQPVAFPGAQGEPCTFLNDCAIGYGCVLINDLIDPTGNICALFCDANGGGGPSCDGLGAGFTCLRINTFYVDVNTPDELGMCAPPDLVP
jgi:hypothetical protein